MTLKNCQWLSQQPSSLDDMRIFCFPYAGGGGSVFKDWKISGLDTIGVYAVNYPGRESRIGERPISTMEELIEGIFNGISDT